MVEVVLVLVLVPVIAVGKQEVEEEEGGWDRSPGARCPLRPLSIHHEGCLHKKVNSGGTRSSQRTILDTPERRVDQGDRGHDYIFEEGPRQRSGPAELLDDPIVLCQ